MILGVCKGFKLLPKSVQRWTREVEAEPRIVDRQESDDLRAFVRNRGVVAVS